MSSNIDEIGMKMQTPFPDFFLFYHIEWIPTQVINLQLKQAINHFKKTRTIFKEDIFFFIF